MLQLITFMRDIHRTSVSAGFYSRLCLNLFYNSETAVSHLNGCSPDHRQFKALMLHCLLAGVKGRVKIMLRPTVTQPVSWCQAPIWGPQDQIFITIRKFRVCWWWMLSLTRWRICRLQFLLVLTEQSFLGPKAPDPWPYFTVSARDSPNLEGQVPVFISPRNRVV
jgi:hypothetical protein